MEKAIFKNDINDTDALIEEFFSYLPPQNLTNAGEGTENFKSKVMLAWKLLLDKSDKKNPEHYLHPLRVALILLQNNLDSDTIVSAILHTLPNHGVSIDEIKSSFGDAVSTIVAGANKIGFFSVSGATSKQADAIRKMMFALSDDVRIILLKLADRLDKMRNLKSYENQTQRAIAEEVLEIWAPLADRLGMQNEKNELEDLSLKYTNPDVFQQIKAIVSQKQDERAAYLKSAVDKITEHAKKHEIEIVNISSRAKHFYSIYQKMRKRNVEAGELFDLLALRVICNTTVECYTLIGIVHDLWKPLEGRFKDYIANPKANGYQSLHTTVMCEGRPLEIQIRTVEMHNMAEHGIASHWLYKKGKTKDLVTESQLGIFNQLQELKKNNFADEGFYADLKNELLKDEIFVFTPKGDVIHLPTDSTAIDFAYAIHSGIGEKICGAKADGKIISLDEPLKNTQIIEILTNPHAHPTESQYKCAKTSKARQKIHSWLSKNDPEFSLDFNDDKEKKNQKPTEEEKRIHHHSKRNPKDFPNENSVPHVGNIKIGTSSNFIFSFAKCCNPKYPEQIIAYLSRTKGMMIHRADCYTYQNIPNREERSLAVDWDV